MNQSQAPTTPVMANDTANTVHKTSRLGYALNVEKSILLLFVFLGITALFASCVPVVPTPAEGLTFPVEVVKSGSNLKITNNTDRDIYFFACPVRLLPVITWTSTVNPNTATNKVIAKSTKDFAKTQFSLEANDSVHFAWWHLGQKVNDSLNLYNADSVRGFTIAP
jgi:hypothetical protein